MSDEVAVHLTIIWYELLISNPSHDSGSINDDGANSSLASSSTFK